MNGKCIKVSSPGSPIWRCRQKRSLCDTHARECVSHHACVWTLTLFSLRVRSVLLCHLCFCWSRSRGASRSNRLFRASRRNPGSYQQILLIWPKKQEKPTAGGQQPVVTEASEVSARGRCSRLSGRRADCAVQSCH